MSTVDKKMDKHIESLVEITESILRGEFEEWKTEIDAEGMLSILAQKINELVVNMKNVESPLTSAGAQAPTAVTSAKNVIDLMAKSTDQVLDNADQCRPEYQEGVYLFSRSLEESLESLIIVALREEWYWHFGKAGGPLSAYHDMVYHIPAPRARAVLKKRLDYALELLDNLLNSVLNRINAGSV